MKKLNKIAIFFISLVFILQFFNIKNNNYTSAVNDNKLTSAESMITIEASSGRVLYSKDENKKLPMASTTKIITAIVAIENCNDLDKKYCITKEMTGIEGSSIYLKAGEKLTVRELLYGLMLRSGNDSAVAIAIIVGGSIAKFVELMNDYCFKLNANDTHIVTVNGLHDDEHYTTASDLAKITAYAMNNETFKEIVSSKEKVISSELDTKYKCRLLKNKNRLLKLVDGANGVKTGYTKKAGRCFVGSATRDGMTIISVVLNCRPMFEETANLIEKAFSEYKLVKLMQAGELGKQDEKIKTQNCSIILKNNIIYPLSSEELSKINAKVEIFDEIKEDSQIGVIDFRIENELIFSSKLFTIIIDKNVGESFREMLLKIIKSF